jgi:hypothetical protein
LVQIPLWQSLSTRHELKAAHGGQTGPPQSVSVSNPSFLPSEQLPQLPPIHGTPAGQQVKPELHDPHI